MICIKKTCIVVVPLLVTACSVFEPKIDSSVQAIDINNFTYTGDVLRKKAIAVSVNSPETKQLANQLLTEVKQGNHAVGLAAPQVGVSKQVFVFQIPENIPDKLKDSNYVTIPWTVAINPQYSPVDKQTHEMTEGCFSVPHFYGTKVPRYKKINYSYTTIDGKKIEGIATGFFAQVFQHETDHLNGKLYIDLVKNKNNLVLLKNLPKTSTK